jgi:predicted AAA+ superfamily ATPase
MITRHLSEFVQSAARTMPVVSITGPRQSGKTTLAKQAFPEYAYANLEHLPTRQYAHENPVGFLKQYPNGLIIDEAQYLPELFSYIQVEVDQSRLNGQYILTGSQNFLLMEKITQSLAGRVAVFNLLPFAARELEGTEYQLTNPFEYMVKGFYPRIYDQMTPIDVFYPSYLLTYLERDCARIATIGATVPDMKLIC